MGEKKFLDINNLVIEYTSDGSIVHAVNGVSLQLDKGKALGLVGETGAGKTTIAKAILRILPDRAAHIQKGEICIEGENLLALSEKEMLKVRGNKISMIFQDPMTALNPTMKIGTQISEVISKHNRISKEEADRRAADMLKLVGIPEDRFHEYPHQFSGGMKQRVVIAIALACKPDLLLADEPTTALDVTIQAQVLALIRQLREQQQTSMILITHDLGVVAETCDEVCIIYAGQVVETGSVKQVFRHPLHPYTRGLFGAMPSISQEEEWLKPIEGMPVDPTDMPKGCFFSPRCPYVCEKCITPQDGLIEVDPGHFTRCGALILEQRGV